MTDRLRDAVASLDAHRAAKAAPEPDLFSLAIAEVVEHHGERWTAQVLEAIRQVALRHAELTAEDLDGLVPPAHDKRGVGPVLLQAARLGYIKRLGWVGSGSKRHGRPLVLWASLIYEGPSGVA